MKSFFSAFGWLAGTLLLLVLFVVSAGVLWQFYDSRAIETEMSRLNEIPDYNYIPEIVLLRERGSLDEALQLARYVKNNPDLPGNSKAAKMEREIDKELNSLSGRAKRTLKGFVTGNADSGAEALGAITSDMILYGDMRDLSIQGYRSATGQEVDPLIVSLSGVGLLTEAVDVADWAPAVLKALRKAGAMTWRFADMLLNLARKSVQAGALDDALKAALSNTADMMKNLGFGRATAVFRHVETTGDLAAMSKLSAKAPDETWLLVKGGGDTTFDTLKTMDVTEDNLGLMRSAARKGPEGARFLDSIRKGGVHRGLITKTRFFARVSKDIKLGRVQAMFTGILDKWPKAAWGMWALAGVTGVWFLLRVLRVLLRFFGFGGRKRVTVKK